MEKYFDASYIFKSIPMLLPFLKVTFIVTGLSVMFGTILGFILAMGKIGKGKLLEKIANGYNHCLKMYAIDCFVISSLLWGSSTIRKIFSSD